MRSRRTSVALLSACLLVAGACRKAAPPAPPDASTTAKALRQRPKNARELPTTDAVIYLENFDGQIEELTRLVREAPTVSANVSRLSAALHTRGRLRGDLDEIQRGIDAATRCIEIEPENGTCHLMRAEQEQSQHRFAASRAELARARSLGVDVHRAAALEADLDWNDGRYDRAIPAIRKARRDRPSVATWMREAQLDHDLGLDDASDAAFEAAEDAIVDTAPLVVAHLNVQRGIQKSDRGQLELACLFFREAVARLPAYVAANEHLAEALHALGRDDEAIAIYEDVVKVSDDPEFAHALSVLRADKGRSEEARALEAKAKARYEVLLVKYPEAMYWHASEFFLDTGDSKRALELLRKNLELRPNSTSRVALARAFLANGAAIDARREIDLALAMPLRSATLYLVASDVYAATDDVAAAAAHRARAAERNPRHGTEPPRDASTRR